MADSVAIGAFTVSPAVSEIVNQIPSGGRSRFVELAIRLVYLLASEDADLHVLVDIEKELAVLMQPAKKKEE